MHWINDRLVCNGLSTKVMRESHLAWPNCLELNQLELSNHQIASSSSLARNIVLLYTRGIDRALREIRSQQATVHSLSSKTQKFWKERS
jgi:hypothetical protein